MQLLRYNDHETDLIYGVGSTLVRNRIILGETDGQSWVAKRSEINFGGNLCVTDKKFKMQLITTPIDFGGRAFVYMYGNKNANKQKIKIKRIGVCAAEGCQPQYDLSEKSPEKTTFATNLGSLQTPCLADMKIDAATEYE